jgi:hypothetical protein
MKGCVTPWPCHLHEKSYRLKAKEELSLKTKIKLFESKSNIFQVLIWSFKFLGLLTFKGEGNQHGWQWVHPSLLQTLLYSSMFVYIFGHAYQGKGYYCV